MLSRAWFCTRGRLIYLIAQHSNRSKLNRIPFSTLPFLFKCIAPPAQTKLVFLLVNRVYFLKSPMYVIYLKAPVYVVFSLTHMPYGYGNR
jgi:hypothetical protein